MKLPKIYKIQAFWQPRIESPGQIVERFSALIEALQLIDPLLAKWYYVSPQGACYDLAIYRANMIDMVVGRVSRGEFEEPTPDFGYHLIACNTPDVNPSSTRLYLQGNVGGADVSDLKMFTSIDLPASPDIVTYKIFSGALKALAAAFEPDWVSASPSDLVGLADSRSTYRIQMPICWMIMVKPGIAKHLSVPSGVISERMRDGGLFLAATSDTFDSHNPVHMAAARTIETVIDPLNTSISFVQSRLQAEKIGTWTG
jgi:hypothetical protein